MMIFPVQDIRSKNSRVVHAHRSGPVHIQGDDLIYLLGAEGVSRVLYPRYGFPNEVFSQSAYQRVCPWHDDICFVQCAHFMVSQLESRAKILALASFLLVPKPPPLAFSPELGPWKNRVQVSALTQR
jgi:hypothetical protein